MQEIRDVAEKFGFNNDELISYGKYMAKVNCVNSKKQEGKLILVAAMTSNKMGIGKTTVSIGLSDALNKMGKRSILALREPSMGPVFGIKGGATGGGKSCVEPSDLINLHFTGDFHAIAQANNLLASIIDNHIFFGNELKIDVNNIFFKRCLDINERSLRQITYQIKGHEINTGFNITAASEVMAVLSLSKDMHDLKNNLGNILVAMSTDGKPIFARDLDAQEPMAILLSEAIKPNLVQTLEGNLALIHLGPFANIAHGCNSIIATRTALHSAEYCVTEAGFGSDLGAEKFLNIKCRVLGKTPDCVVLVIVNEVIKQHGNGDLLNGFKNVKRHINNIRERYGLPVVVAINKHKSDSEDEIALIKSLCEKLNVKAVIAQGYEEGSDGCLELAEEVSLACQSQSYMNYTYDLNDSIKDKIEKIAKNIYGAKCVNYSKNADEKINLAIKFGFNNFFVNIAKTQFSFSGDKNMLGAPEDFELFISDIEIRSGAKMIVAIAGDMLLMPGLGRDSNYRRMSILDNGEIIGII